MGGEGGWERERGSEERREGGGGEDWRTAGEGEGGWGRVKRGGGGSEKGGGWKCEQEAMFCNRCMRARAKFGILCKRCVCVCAKADCRTVSFNCNNSVLDS